MMGGSELPSDGSELPQCCGSHAGASRVLCASPCLPEGGLAAASTLVLLLSMVVMPALAMEMVCCSMACVCGWEGGGRG